MKTEAQKRARNKYKLKVKKYTLECYPTEPEIIAKLEAERQADGYSAYIKRLIKEDIARN